VHRLQDSAGGEIEAEERPIAGRHSWIVVQRDPEHVCAGGNRAGVPGDPKRRGDALRRRRLAGIARRQHNGADGSHDH
jgi:hypothetical protein